MASVEDEDSPEATVRIDDPLEEAACTPTPVVQHRFNPNAQIPYGVTVEHIAKAMNEFIGFLGFVNKQLHTKAIARFESMLMPANFSSMVGEFMTATIPKYCNTIVKNTYHNGHPDMLPNGRFPNNALQHGTEGIEVKASRYSKGWQGHNPEQCWLMVFVFDSSRPNDSSKGVKPIPFRFKGVYLGNLTTDDWKLAGRNEGSRRTITASIIPSGFKKMTDNWVYQDDGTNLEEDLFAIAAGL